MMIQRPDQRVAVFIDTQNMYHSAKNIFNAKVNFPSLVEGVVGARMLSRAIAYVAKSKTGEETAFFEALLQNGIELKIKDVQEFSSGAKKADFDVAMAVDAIAIASKVDVIVLATGDGDFVPLVHYLKAQGVICEVASFSESTNAQLKEVADALLDLSAEPERFLIMARKPASRSKTSKSKASDNEKPAGLRNIRITY
ncbi:NYN domain-containing protein [Candidatus Uhrbacteria bacterium]|nr:NYN domain-containing protein [Candidatus Uhrbacteria bacterium]